MTAAQPNSTPAPAPANPTTIVQKQVNSYLEKGTLRLPANYSPENALKSAWLTLQSVVDRDNKPALNVCDNVSIQNALLDMIVQGLNPAKKQMYFIVYGKALVCQRSYFGDILLAQRVLPGSEVYYDVVREGDKIKLTKERGRTFISHETTLEAQSKDIIGAYCGIVSDDGENLGCEYMTIEAIRQSWSQSKTYKPEGGNTPHHKFPAEMALRTVIRKRCKPVINSANDDMLLAAVRRSEESAIDAEFSEELALNANAEVISMDEPTPPAETEVQAEEAQAAPAADAQPTLDDADDTTTEKGPVY